MAKIASKLYEQLNQINLEQYNNHKTCLVVVDMVNGFVKSGNMADRQIESIIPVIKKITQILNSAKHLYFVDAHEKMCEEFKYFPEHCLLNDVESEIVDELKEDSIQSTIILKNSTNGFLAPEFLNNIDENMNYDQFVITGCCSDICVMQFALTLKTYIHQYDLNKKVIVVADAIETYNGINHGAELFNEMAIQLMMNSGIEVVRI